jgi:uncharacterized protein
MPRILRAFLLAFTATLALAAPASAQPTPSSDVVVSQVYGGGGNSGATLTNDFIELFNRGTTTIDLSGWSVQYASAAGSTWQKTDLTGTIAPGGYYLVGEGAGAGGTTPLPTPDATGGIAMAGTAGKVALVTSQTALTLCGATPSSCSARADVRDFVGYGSTASDYEGTGAAPTLTNTTADLRAALGCTDTNVNSADFSAGTPNPRNSAAATNPCGGPPPGDAAPSVTDTDPGNGDDEVDRDANITVTFSEPVDATDDAFSLACDGTDFALAVSGDGTTYTLDPAEQLPRDARCTLTVEADAVTDQDSDDPPDTMAADYTATFSTDSSVAGLRIHDIQGTRHISPYRGALALAVPGVITALRTNGYFIQDPRPDGESRTSEGIFVFTSTPPDLALTPGTAVTVTGRVTEFRAGGATSANLTVTELTSATALPAGTGTIAPTLVGKGGRVPPTTVIEDDAVDPGGEDPTATSGDVEQGDPLFDPQEDGIDFYESLEGMLTEVRNATVVGPTSVFGSGATENREIPVLADGGAGASVRADRGPILVRGFDQSAPQEFRRGDFNPERITLNDTNDPNGTFLPLADVSDRFTAPVRAIVDYNFGAFKFLALNNPKLADGRLKPETTRKQQRNELAVASYNVENLDGLDPQARYDRVASQIVGNLRAPDILSLEEIQDNDGAASASPTSADVTYTRLIAAIRAAGGPTYQYRQVDPASNQDGGEPNGNIRVAFLFRTDNRDLSFVDREGPTPTTAATATEPVAGPRGTAQLTVSPGRVEPTNTVFTNSRKPLAAEFRYRGKPLFIVGNHFASKGGDDPVFGRFQEPRRSSEIQRRGSATDGDPVRGQAGVVNAFVRSILDIDSRALVLVLGDLNDFEFSETVKVLERGADREGLELVDLWHFVPQDERYSYIFQGNGQILDHILVSPALLLQGRPDLDSVHINAEFADQAADHDPPISRFDVGR